MKELQKGAKGIRTHSVGEREDLSVLLFCHAGSSPVVKERRKKRKESRGRQILRGMREVFLEGKKRERGRLMSARKLSICPG